MYMRQLQDVHLQYIEAAKQKDPALILSYYSDSTLFNPDFHPLTLGKENINKYYKTIFDRQNILAFSKESKDIICFANRIVEWGIFKKEVKQKSSTYDLSGKFLNVWDITADGKLTLVSEQWNYNHKIHDSINLYVELPSVPLRYKTKPASNISKSLKYELDAYALMGTKAVKNRDPYGRLNSYDSDGIFLAPHGEPAKIGYDEIKDYLINYNSGDVIIDSIEVGYNHVEDYGDFIIKSNYYYVEASGNGWKHQGQGHGAEVMKRNSNGQLRRLWQIGTEHRPKQKPAPPSIELFEKATITNLLEGNIKARSKFYTEDSYLMGEYQNVLKGKSNINGYFSAFLNRFHVTHYEKERLELLDMGEWMLETGSFKMKLHHKKNDTRKMYEGKYQNLWKRQENGDWKIFAEAWNYNHSVDNWEQFDFPNINAYDHLNAIVSNCPTQVLGMNLLSEEIISNHDEKTWSELYDDHAMLLYSHSPLYNGKNSITAHLREHVKTLPTFNTLDISNFFVVELEKYIIELGNHSTDWSYDEDRGLSTGKNIRIWKKKDNGSIKIYRQTAMYDINQNKKTNNQERLEWVTTYDNSKTRAKATLKDLNWLKGSWVASSNGHVTEHIIQDEKERQMPGFVRSVNKDKISFYEITTFVEQDSSVHYKVKHFSSNLEGWEAQHESIDRPLVKKSGNTLFFDGITFRKRDNANFTVYFLIQEGNQKGEVLEIDFRRLD